jgi:hypothetical protein
MRKLIFLIICVASLHSPAQVCDDIPNNTTDPNNPQHYNGNDPTTNTYINLRPDGSGLPKLDWLQNEYEWWHEAPLGGPDFNCDVDNPFWTTTNDDNVDQLFDLNPLLRDNRPEDGWELIVFNFGIRIDTDQVKSIDHPYMVLYNKYRGILRVLYHLREPNFNEDYDLATIKLSFIDAPLDIHSANLNHAEEVAKPIDLYRKDQNEQMANQLDNGITDVDECTGMWLYADFVMAYDPCVCQYDYNRFQIEVQAVNKASVVLTGDITTAVATKTQGTQNGYANTSSSYKTGFKTVEGVAKDAKTYYKNGSDWVGFVAGIAGKIPPKKVDEITKYTKLAKGVPYLGAAIGVVNFFLFQAETESKPAQQAVSFNATVNLTGTIEDIGTPENIVFHVPGSDYGISNSNTKPNEVPLYDEPLGIVSLLKTPRIEFSNVNNARDIEFPNGLEPITQGLPTVSMYKVIDPLELVINPSSELEIEEVKASFVLTYSSNLEKSFENTLTTDQLLNYPYVPGASIQQTSQFSASGGWTVIGVGTYDDAAWQMTTGSSANLELQEPDNYYKVSYGQAPIGCFQNKSFYLISQDPPTQGTLPIIVIRLNITMKHPSTGLLYKFVQSYEVDKSKISEKPGETQHYDVEITGSEFFLNEAQEALRVTAPFILKPYIGSIFSNYYETYNIKDFRFFENETVEGFVDAWDGIIIGDNVNIKPGTYMTAGRYIYVQPENKISPEVKMQIGTREATCQDPPNNFVIEDPSVLASFCTGPTKIYNPALAKKDFFENEDDKEETQSYNFNLYPNPTDNLVNIEVELVDSATYTLEVLDLSGRVVYNRTLNSSEFDNSTTAINTSSLESGIYFVNVTEGDNRMTKRLIITR